MENVFVKVICSQIFCPLAGPALPFPIDEKEAKILSKRTLRRAF